MGNQYWDKRAEARMDEYLRDSQQTLKTVYQATYEAQKQIERNIEAIIKTFGKRFDMTEDEVKKLLANPIGQEEYKKLLQQIATLPDGKEKKALMALADSGGAGYRLSQQEAIRVNIQTQMAKIADVQQAELTSLLEKVADKAYSKSIFDVQKGTGVGFSFSGINQGAIQEILRNPWSGEHYSSRIWGNSKALQQILEEKLTPYFLNTKSMYQIAEELEETMNVSRHAATRLVRTETAYVANMAEQQSYREMGIERYRFLSTLDNKTSQICQELDGEIFEVAKAQVGENMPPMHPHCRSTTVVVIDDEELAEMTRWAKDPVTGEQVKVPGDMTYKEWLKMHEGTYGNEKVKQARKMALNIEKDKAQYREYKKVLGKEKAPETFDLFRQIKYNDDSGYQDLITSYKQQNQADWQQSMLAPSEAKSPYARFASEEDIPKWMLEQATKWNLDEIDALYHYSTSAHEGLNGYLRGYGPATAEILDNIKHISRAIEKAPIEENITLWRGTSLRAFVNGTSLEELPVDSWTNIKVKDNAFMSTSVFRNEAEKFESQVLIEILAPKDATGAYMGADGLSQYSYEKEILLNKGTELHIMRAEKRGPNYYILAKLLR